MALNFANNNSLSAITSLPASISGGALTLLQTQTASSSSTISFTSGIDSTYKSYIFKFYNIHPATDNAKFQFNLSTDSGSNYNVTKTTTFFRAVHYEDGSSAGLLYSTGQDLAQSTDFANIVDGVGSDADQNMSGFLEIFDPSNTVFVKHFLSNANTCTDDNATKNVYGAGYGNTTSSIDAVQFKMSSGNIDSGVIKLYGIS